VFVDKVSTHIKAGKGGNGMIAFRREKYVDKGGPSGGDGGRGGSVYFIADSGLTTLLDFKYKRKIAAPDGGKGMGKDCSGRAAEDIVVKVPVGTIVYDNNSKRIIADFKYPNQKELIAKGGRGGRGNAHFVSSRNQVPRVAENGEPGVEFDATLELKVLADVGLVGYPSVGKSTLLAAVTAAKPEIASYPFTTLTPNLGVVAVKDGRSFVMADLPGLIEGAHNGKGLGLQFLRHIERCRVLIHIVDMASSEGRDPINDFKVINDELKSYRMRLLERPMVVAANKMDDPGAILLLDEFKKVYGKDYKIFPISALERTGLDELLYYVADLLAKTPEFPLLDADFISPEKAVYEMRADDKGFTITKVGDHHFVISGERIEKLYKMTNISEDQGFLYLTTTMRKMGIDDELIRLGAQNGDQVDLLDFTFEYFE
jgi:GTPase